MLCACKFLPTIRRLDLKVLAHQLHEGYAIFVFLLGEIKRSSNRSEAIPPMQALLFDAMSKSPYIQVR